MDRRRTGSTAARRVACGMLALGCAAMLGGPGVRPADAAAEPGISIAAEIKMSDFGTEASLNEVMLDLPARRLVYWDDGSAIHSLDIDSHRELAKRFYTTSQINLPAAVDTRHHRLFHLAKTVPATLEILDTRTLELLGTTTLTPTMGDAYAGFAWSDRDQLLYEVYAVAVAGGLGDSTQIAAIDPAAPSAALAVRWTEQLPGCDRPLALNNAAALGETEDGRYLVTACNTLGAGSGAVARLALPGPGQTADVVWNGAVQLFPGLVLGSTNGVAAWVPHQDRLFVQVASNQGRGVAAYIFDAPTGRYVGAPSLFVPANEHVSYGGTAALGVDPTTGRLIAQDRATATTGRAADGSVCSGVPPGGNTLVVQETAIAGASPRQFSLGDDAIDGGGHVIGYDPVAHNWWMWASRYVLPPFGSCGLTPSVVGSYLVVLHDTLPAAAVPPAANPDAGTRDMPEQAGVTGANVEADASAYGVHMTFGPSGANGSVSASGQDCNLAADASHDTATTPALQILDAPPAPPQYHSFCNAHGRTATFAHVDRVALDSAEARATAITGDTDHETGQDMQSGSDFSQPGLYADSVTGYANRAAAAATAGAGQSPPAAAPTPCPAASSPPTGVVPPLLPGSPASPGGPTSCDQALKPVQPLLAGDALPYLPATCGDDSTNTGGATQPPPPLQLHQFPANSPLHFPGSAAVFCSLVEQRAQGHADQSSTSAAGPLDDPVAAMTATADALVRRNAAEGSVAQATSTVKDISVGNVLHVAALTTAARASAHGLPGTNAVSFTCTVSGLTVTLPAGLSVPPSVAQVLPPGVPTTIPQASCWDSRVQQVVAAFDGAFAGALEVSFPAAPTAADGAPGGAAAVVQRRSPGGYLAAVALSDLDQVQNSILVNDSSIEQPGMVVTAYLDNSNARNHLVTSFAGVAVATRYGIFPLDDSAGPGDGDQAPETGVVGQALDTLGPAEGGPPPLVAATGPPGGDGRGPLGGLNPAALARAVADGFRWLWQHPAVIPALLAVWLLFAGPAYVLARRRALLLLT